MTFSGSVRQCWEEICWGGGGGTPGEIGVNPSWGAGIDPERRLGPGQMQREGVGAGLGQPVLSAVAESDCSKLGRSIIALADRQRLGKDGLPAQHPQTRKGARGSGTHGDVKRCIVCATGRKPPTRLPFPWWVLCALYFEVHYFVTTSSGTAEPA